MVAHRAMHTPSNGIQLAIESAPRTSAAVAKMNEDQSHLSNLPVELQEMILAYVGTSDQAPLDILKANHSTADHQQR